MNKYTAHLRHLNITKQLELRQGHISPPKQLPRSSALLHLSQIQPAAHRLRPRRYRPHNLLQKFRVLYIRQTVEHIVMARRSRHSHYQILVIQEVLHQIALHAVIPLVPPVIRKDDIPRSKVRFKLADPILLRYARRFPEREELQARPNEIFCVDQTIGKMKTPLECGAFRGFGYVWKA